MYSPNILFALLGKLTLSAKEKAVALMDEITDFSKTFQMPSLNRARVIIRQRDTLAIFVEEMRKASETGGKLEKMVTTPMRYIGSY